MPEKFRDWNMKKWIAVLISLLFITNILIVLNIPFLRESVAFIYFSTVPGILILHLIKLNRIEFIKKVVLQVGLSISFMIFVGWLLNSLFPLLLKPLSLAPVLISFNVLLIIMALVAYWRNKENFVLKDFLNFNVNLDGKLTSMFIFPILFPFMAILGTHLMNTTENNIILLLMLFLIPIYVVLVAILKDRIHSATYSFSIFTISLSFLLMYGLTSNFIMGRDVHNEFYCFQLALENFHWNIYDYYNPYNACLSITILPVIYKVLTGISDHYIFKLVFAIVGAFIPIIIYITAKKYISKRYAFYAALLFVFQLFFMNILGAVRQQIAILFFFLALMVIFSSDINKYSRKLLFLILFFSLLVSHYTTAYVAYVLIFPLLLVPFIEKLFKERKIVTTNFDLILLSLGFIALWYFLYANVQFYAGGQVVQRTVVAATGAVSGQGGHVHATRGDFVLGILGIQIKSIPNFISIIAHNLTFATILAGVAGFIWRFRYYRQKFETEFILGIFLSLILLVSFVLLPYISIAYDAARLFFQLLIFLAPAFIIGAITIAKFIKKPEWDIAIILVLLIFLFSCTTYLQYHFYGMPYSATYEKDGIVRGEVFIYGAEIAGVYWLKENRIKNINIYSDDRALFRYSVANFRVPEINTTFFQTNKTVDQGYIYLGKVNIKKRQLYFISDDIVILNLNDYLHLFNGKEIVYDNGASQIWT